MLATGSICQVASKHQMMYVSVYLVDGMAPISEELYQGRDRLMRLMMLQRNALSALYSHCTIDIDASVTACTCPVAWISL